MFADHHISVSNIKKEKKHRSSKVYRKNHRTITLHRIQPNERVNSPSSVDDDSYNTAESDSSESPENHMPNKSYAKSKRRKKLRPPKPMRRNRQRPVPAHERIRTKQTALSFDVTEVYEPPPTRENIATTPEKRKSPVSLSPKQNENPPLPVAALGPRHMRHDEGWKVGQDEDWSNLSDEDDFSDYHNGGGANNAEYHNDEGDDSLDEDFDG